MLEAAFTVVPTTRLEAELQMPYLHEPGHVDLLYETDCNVHEPHLQNTFQKCVSCGAGIMDKCVMFQDQWVCAFCNKFNPVVEKAPATPYEVEITEPSSAAVPSNIDNVLVIDLLVTTPDELQSIKDLVTARVKAGKSDATYGLVSITDGEVAVHTTSSCNTFSIDEHGVSAKAKSMDSQYFVEKLPPIVDLSMTADQLIHSLTSLQPATLDNKDQRPRRATGVAFFLTSIYSQTQAVGHPVSVTAFISGPCTAGPGKVLPKNKKYHIRQHYELDARRDKYFNSARGYYQQLSEKIQVRLLISNLDQIGVVELAPVCLEIDQFDSFFEERFKNLALRWWPNDVNENEITVFAPKNLSIDGCFGLVSKLKPSQITYSDTPCGVSGTNRWRSWSSRPSLAFSFQIVTQATKDASIDVTPVHSVVQIQHSYKRNAKRYVKVDAVIITTTNAHMSGSWSVAKSLNITVALTCLMKQIAFSQLVKGRTHSLHLQEWQTRIDKLAARHFKAFSKNYSKLLEYLYYLKWTALLQKRNTSPDEAAIYQHTILTQDKEIAKLLCKPRVTLFTNDTKSEISILNEQLMQQNQAMCVDLGTIVLIRYSEDSAIPTQQAQEMADALVRSRHLPTRLEKTPVHGSQDRYFISKLVPDGNANTEALSLGEFNGLVRKLAMCI
ncbi:LAFA_0E12882g1_1 [Lachancea sp. 'fantastica']|nr:LAFA_0E12882g1_1 [Lachancea sp. 'fantastica']